MKMKDLISSRRVAPLASMVLSASLLGLLASCGDSAQHDYDTAEGLPAPAGHPSTPGSVTYGAAAYEDNTQPTDPQAITATPTTSEPALALPAAQQDANAVATPRFHYVAPGDSLWKISKQYKVPVASIKAANNMSNDIVVLGKKMIIPAH